MLWLRLERGLEGSNRKQAALGSCPDDPGEGCGLNKVVAKQMDRSENFVIACVLDGLSRQVLNGVPVAGGVLERDLPCPIKATELLWLRTYKRRRLPLFSMG